MSYTKQEFKSGEKLYAAQLNAMDEQIAANAEAVGKISEEVVTIPDYWNEYLDNKIEAIKKRQMAAGKDCYSFVVITDIHYRGNRKRSPALIKRIMEECGIKFCLCLGDIQNGGAWKTKELELAEWVGIDKMLKPIRKELLTIPGNHDGAYGEADINGDGEIAGSTDYYIYNLTPDEIYDLIYRKVGLIPGVNFDETRNGYYIDDTINKVRYIMVNTHYSDGATNEDGTAINNYMRKIRVGQSQVNMVIDALSTIPDNAWNVVVGMHIPLAPLFDSGPSKDMELLRDVLEAYQNRASYSGEFGTAGEYDHISVNTNFTQAKGKVIITVCGHVHRDGINSDYAFPIITSYSDDVGATHIFGEIETGTTDEQSFDVITVNKRTNTINLTKIGYGEDRVIHFQHDLPYTNLADINSVDWLEHTAIGDKEDAYNTSFTRIATNYIPVSEGDILRFKGIDTEALDDADKSHPRLVCYDENKAYVAALYLDTAMVSDGRSICNVIGDEGNGVKSYTILLRGSTGEQFTYNDFNTRTKYIRFNCVPTGKSEDIIITVNEEIV